MCRMATSGGHHSNARLALAWTLAALAALAAPAAAQRCPPAYVRGCSDLDDYSVCTSGSRMCSQRNGGGTWSCGDCSGGFGIALEDRLPPPLLPSCETLYLSEATCDDLKRECRRQGYSGLQYASTSSGSDLFGSYTCEGCLGGASVYDSSSAGGNEGIPHWAKWVYMVACVLLGAAFRAVWHFCGGCAALDPPLGFTGPCGMPGNTHQLASVAIGELHDRGMTEFVLEESSTVALCWGRSPHYKETSRGERVTEYLTGVIVTVATTMLFSAASFGSKEWSCSYSETSYRSGDGSVYSSTSSSVSSESSTLPLFESDDGPDLWVDIICTFFIKTAIASLILRALVASEWARQRYVISKILAFGLALTMLAASVAAASKSLAQVQEYFIIEAVTTLLLNPVADVVFNLLRYIALASCPCFRAPGEQVGDPFRTSLSKSNTRVAPQVVVWQQQHAPAVQVVAPMIPR